MKITNKILIFATSLALLTACSDGVTDHVYTVGEADNEINLHAGISNSPITQTRASAQGAHVPFANTTQMRLYVEGTWTGKTSPTITKYTNCKTTTATSEFDNVSGATNDIHPLESYTPQLFWDDYGTADPGNATNRANGLSVYGVAVDGLATLPDDLKAIKINDTNGNSWESLSWSVDKDGTDVLKKDIVVSNNHSDNTSSTGTGIKFTDRTDASKNILEYQHLMSKVTFVLSAGAGFTGNKFTSTPEVILTRNLYNNTTNTEYCITEGTVNIKAASAAGAATPVVNPVKLQHSNTTNAGVVTEHALVFPGSCFGTRDGDIIARINADDNIYYVTAKAIRTAIASTHTDYKTKSGYNYIINVTIDKTEIHVTATVKDWIDVTADNETPKINVTTAITGTSNKNDAFTSFDFYLSDNAASQPSTAYEKKAKATGTQTDGTTVWTFVDASNSTINLYWPTHSTHYHMRGVYPLSTTVTSGKISVTSGDYDALLSPSNLLVGAPVFTDENKNCNNGDHTSVDMSTNGICAREGSINLAFDYMMSQIEVRLTTSTGDPVPADAVNLTNAKVEIVGGYTSGSVDIHNKTVATSGSVSDFEVKHVGTEDTNYRHSIFVPQTFTDNLKFKITIYKTGSTTDVDDIYYATIKDIKVKEPGDTNSKLISKWDSGKHYIYTLDVRKTEIKVTATITDWVTVNADQPIWF